jgi:hypothetical protein
VPWFRCFIHGEGFPGAILNEAGPVGFYLTRFVEATDPKAAETAALTLLRAEPNLAPPPGFVPTGQARVLFEEIEEIDADDVPEVPPGFVWYRMPPEEAAPAEQPG